MKEFDVMLILEANVRIFAESEDDVESAVDSKALMQMEIGDVKIETIEEIT